MFTFSSEEKQSRFRTLKSLIPFLEGLGFRVKRGVDHITIYPYPENKVEVKVSGADALKKVMPEIQKIVVDGVNEAIQKFKALAKE